MFVLIWQSTTDCVVKTKQTSHKLLEVEETQTKAPTDFLSGEDQSLLLTWVLEYCITGGEQPKTRKPSPQPTLAETMLLAFPINSNACIGD